MQGGKAEKEMKGVGVEREIRGNVVVHSGICVSYSLLWGGQKKRGRGQGQRGRETERRGRKERMLKTLPLCWQVLYDSSDIKVLSPTVELCVCVSGQAGGGSGDFIHSSAVWEGVRDNVNTLITPNDLFP